LENLAQRSCKWVKSFKKNKNSKKKSWVDRELSDLKKTVIQLGSALKKQPFNLKLKK
jgi:RAB protein geranylgeranyltransferase component A